MSDWIPFNEAKTLQALEKDHLIFGSDTETYVQRLPADKMKSADEDSPAPKTGRKSAAKESKPHKAVKISEPERHPKGRKMPASSAKIASDKRKNVSSQTKMEAIKAEPQEVHGLQVPPPVLKRSSCKTFHCQVCVCDVIGKFKSKVE